MSNFSNFENFIMYSKSKYQTVSAKCREQNLEQKLKKGHPNCRPKMAFSKRYARPGGRQVAYRGGGGEFKTKAH